MSLSEWLFVGAWATPLKEISLLSATLRCLVDPCGGMRAFEAIPLHDGTRVGQP